MTRLEEIADAFSSVDRQMRLELLLDYVDHLPPLPEAYLPLRDRGLNMVHECQAPVFLMVRIEDGQVRLYADVPREAPTARSFTAILHDSFDGAAPQTILDAPNDVLHRLGLIDLIGVQRTRGLNAIYHRVKHEVQRQLQED